MRLSFRPLSLLLLALAIASCASPAKMARQSREALARGDLRRAYDRAEDAIEKDPRSPSARNAYGAASEAVAADYRQRVVALAATDTAAGADLALEARQFRARVVAHQTALQPVLDYDAAEARILSGAARIHYQRGLGAMASRRPRLAVVEFLATRRYDENYADVVARLETAQREGTVRVALVPFANDVNVPGLSQEIGDSVQRQIARRNFRFTQIVGAEEIERHMTVAMQRNPSRVESEALGRKIGADWVLLGRFRGLRSTSSDRAETIPVFHRVDVKDANGTVTGSRWDELTIRTMRRERDVSVQVDFEVIEVATGKVLATRDQLARAIARVAWTDFRAETPYDRYALLPPDVRRGDAERARKVDAQWQAQLGSWELHELLRSAREERSRARYSPNYRREFYVDTRLRPVWLGELPSENDLAFVALNDVWRLVLTALSELDSAN